MNKWIKIKIRLKLYFTEKLVESFHYLLIFWTQWIPKQTILISVPRTEANNHLIVWSVLFSLFESVVTRKSHFILYRHCTLRHQKTSKYLSSENFTPFQVTNTLKILLIFSKVLLTAVWTPPPPPTFFVWHVLFHFSSAYQVIVLKVADGNETLPPDFDSKLKNSDGALQSDIDFYISAEIRNVPVQKTTWEFTIGDEENHEGYKNTALQQGEDYIVFQRALTNDGTEKVSLV